MPEIRKDHLSSDNDIFLNFGKMPKFWSVGLGIFDGVLVSMF